jgi:S1-C subfamily serine protease
MRILVLNLGTESTQAVEHALTDKIIYDAATTSGGSGGPLFNRDGKVIGVSSAILKDFGGSNLAVPVRYADELLK